DRTSGTAATPSYRVCGNSDCAGEQLSSAQVGGDGTLRVVLGVGSAYGTPLVPPQVIGIDAAAQTPPAMRTAQSGIDGVWFAPYESGQGFVIDYLAASNTVFMPWFTFTQAGGEDPAALAWFTLQGTVSAGADGIDLLIGASDGGVFQSG